MTAGNTINNPVQNAENTADQNSTQPALDGVQEADRRAENAGHDLAGTDQDTRKAAQDARDEDQDAASRGRNTTDDAASALHHTNDALRALGINDPTLDNLANTLSHGADSLFGHKPPDVLPSVKYRLFFGEKGKMSSILGGLKDSAVGLADELLGDVTHAAGEALRGVSGAAADIVEGMGEDTISSMTARQPDISGASEWAVAQIQIDEQLSGVGYCELILVRTEQQPPPEMEAELDGENDSSNAIGGLIGAIKHGIHEAEHLIDDVKNEISEVGHLLTHPGDLLGMAGGLLGGGDGGAVPDPALYMNIPVDPADYLNKVASVCVYREDEQQGADHLGDNGQQYIFAHRWYTGYVVEIEDLGVRHENPKPQQSQRYVRMVLSSGLAKLSLRKNCRIFENRTAIQIVREIIRDASLFGSVAAAGILGAIPGVDAVEGLVSKGLTAVGDAIGMGGIAGEAADAIDDALSAQRVKCIPPRGKTERTWVPKREYCVQYNETDLDFVRRLLEEEGITFFIEHDRGEERLVLIDDVHKIKKCHTIDGRAVPYAPPELLIGPPTEFAWNISLKTRMRSKRFVLRDFGWSDVDLPPTDLPKSTAGQQSTVDPTLAAEDDFAQYEYPAHVARQYEDDGRYYKPYDDAGPDGHRIVKRRLEEAVSQAERGHLHTNLTGVAPGIHIRLKGHVNYAHPDLDHSQWLLVVSARHFGTVAKYAQQVSRFLGYDFEQRMHPLDPAIPKPPASNITSQGVVRPGDVTPRGAVGPEYAYYNRVEFQFLNPKEPQTTPFRPARLTPRPIVRGLQTATVVGNVIDEFLPSGLDDRVHIDDKRIGRVKVHFHWDQRQEGLSVASLLNTVTSRFASCWVRVAQSWAGDNWGTVFIPRIGMEVVVGFEEGDPDRPLVLGCVYNGLNPVPAYDLTNPAAVQHNWSVFKTQTNPGSDETRFNELRLDDTKDKEEIRVRAEKYLVEEVRNDHATDVGHDQTNTVNGYHSELIDGAQRLTVRKNRTKTVVSDEVKRTTGNRDEIIHGDEESLIDGKRTEVVEGYDLLTVGAHDDDKPDEVRRTHTTFGTQDTVIGWHPPGGDPNEPPDAEHMNDVLLVKKNKTDTIMGPYTVFMGGMGTGAAPDADGKTQHSGVAVQPAGLQVRSDDKVYFHAKTAVELVTEHNDIEVDAGRAVCWAAADSIEDARDAKNSLRMSADADDPPLPTGAGISLLGERISIMIGEADKGRLYIDDDSAFFWIPPKSPTESAEGFEINVQTRNLTLTGATVDIHAIDTIAPSGGAFIKISHSEGDLAAAAKDPTPGGQGPSDPVGVGTAGATGNASANNGAAGPGGSPGTTKFDSKPSENSGSGSDPDDGSNPDGGSNPGGASAGGV